MRIAITSDQHWHDYKEFSRLQEDGSSFRLSLYRKSLLFVDNYCKNNRIKTIIDAGDVFHSRENISTDVLDLLGQTLSEIETKMYFLKGNHDTGNKRGNVSTLNILSEFGTVINENKIISIDSNGCYSDECLINFIPWNDNDNFVDCVNNNQKVNIVIAHRMLKGAKSNNIILDGESISGLNKDKFDCAFIGHVHEYQKLEEKIYYIGSLTANNFNDIDQEKGFIVYDTVKKTFERIKNPFSPIYKKIKISSKEDIEKLGKPNENEFWDLRVDIEKIDDFVDINIPNVRVTAVKSNFDEKRIDDSDLLTPQLLLSKFCDLDKTTEKRKNIGMKILEECLK